MGFPNTNGGNFFLVGNINDGFNILPAFAILTASGFGMVKFLNDNNLWMAEDDIVVILNEVKNPKALRSKSFNDYM
ncbi:hypothetical protein QFZ20_003363 [Flavobacterium sp. W4I14]|nr:hypothetical protein [Flavobacterium sp. W4I14]